MKDNLFDEIRENFNQRFNELLKYAVIKKIKGKYYLFDSKGKRVLGVHKTYKDALRQERAIQLAKKRRRK